MHTLRALTLGLLLLSSEVALAGPYVSGTGTCPGSSTLTIGGLTPGGRFSLLTSTDLGTFQIPGGPCAGTVTELSPQGLTRRVSSRADQDGSASVVRNLPPQGCLEAFQVLDVETCTLSLVGGVDACASGTCGPIAWSASAYTFGLGCPADVGDRFTFVCAPGGVPGVVWGTNLYTHDSSICPAAQHSGRIDPEDGGVVTLEMVTGQSSYPGTSRNGVTSLSFGAWSCSYAFP